MNTITTKPATTGADAPATGPLTWPNWPSAARSRTSSAAKSRWHAIAPKAS